MNEEKINYTECVDKYYTDNKTKYYYSTSEIREIAGVSLRTLRYRIKDLKEKYKNVPSLLSKKNGQWRIHADIVDEFLPKNKPRRWTVTNFNWVSFGTWSMYNKFDRDYHLQLMVEVAERLEKNHFLYTIELNNNGVYHTHFITDGDDGEVTRCVKEVIAQYLPPKTYRVEVTPVRGRHQSLRYLKK